jgi:hypothetical protein
MRLESKYCLLFLITLCLSVLSCKPDKTDYFEDVAFDLAGETSKTWVMNAMPTGPCAPELLLPLNTITNIVLRERVGVLKIINPDVREGKYSSP